MSETSFDAYCEKQIFKPLEMNHSAWFRKDLDTLQMAKQYIYANETNLEDEFFSKLIHVKRGDFYELCPYSFHNYPDGLFKTTLTDLSHFMLTIMNNGQYKNVQLLQPKTLLEDFQTSS